MASQTYPIFAVGPTNAIRFCDNPGEVFDLVRDQVSLDLSDHTFADALQDDWDDAEHRLDVFGPHFTEETLKDTMDLCEAAAALSKGYIL